MRRRRQFAVGGVIVLLLLIYFAFFSGGSSPPPKSATTTAPRTAATAEHFPKHSPLNPDWKGNGKTVTLGFGGDVHFAGAVGESLAAGPLDRPRHDHPPALRRDPATHGEPRDGGDRRDLPRAPEQAVHLRRARVRRHRAQERHRLAWPPRPTTTAWTAAPQGLSQNLTIASQASYPIIGIGNNAAQAFTPYRVTIDGQRIAIIAATQVIADNLVSTWTATATQPGVASAIDPTELVREVQQVRRTADTVIVYVHWGTETQACPNPQQEPLAEQLVKAGADIVIGSGAHVLLGGGYLGSAYVDYGLGNFAFYDDTAPETDSGTLIITAEGRHITGAVWRPATILDGLPQPLTGTPAAAAVQSWNAARSCTNLSRRPSTSLTTMRGETVPFVAPGRATDHHDHDDRSRRPSGIDGHAPGRGDRVDGSTGSGPPPPPRRRPHPPRPPPPRPTTRAEPHRTAASLRRPLRAGRSWTRCGASPRRRPRRECAGSGTGSPPGRSAR